MPKRQTIAQKIQSYLRALEAGKAGYGKANELLEALVNEMKPGQIIALEGNQTAQLVDKFAEKNRIGAGLGVNRYEIEVSRAADVTAKL